MTSEELTRLCAEVRAQPLLRGLHRDTIRAVVEATVRALDARTAEAKAIAVALSQEQRAFYEAARTWKRHVNRFDAAPKDERGEVGRKIRRLRMVMGDAYAAMLASEARIDAELRRTT